MTDKKILDYIFKKGETEFTEDELKFMRKIDVERKKRDCPFKSGEPYDYMAIGIYMGIKSQAVKTFQEELNKGFDVLSKMGDIPKKELEDLKNNIAISE